MITSASYGYEYRGLSTDDKSALARQFSNGVIPNGTVFFEMDTSKAFMYDADSDTWLEL